MWQIGPGSIWQIGPGSMWQIGPGSMWQIKAKDGEKKKKRKEERLNDGNNNGQATHGARKPPGPKCNYIVIGKLMFYLCLI